MLGEHTAEVLRELLGMSPEAVAALREQGVIGGPSTP
jgi:crotonobetainyl-CoA:carnitine CoA-transferase CaiB-like acyl-CoA transferase